jgi:hypothetical protein
MPTLRLSLWHMMGCILLPRSHCSAPRTVRPAASTMAPLAVIWDNTTAVYQVHIHTFFRRMAFSCAMVQTMCANGRSRHEIPCTCT